MALNAKTQDQSLPSPVPALALPKGGGAIHGIGETFSTDAMSGTASLAVPIAVTAGRSGFAPRLSLTYDTGNGNGIFGVGWSLALPEVARKTQKGLPRYGGDEDPDVFILSGYDDLVPMLQQEAGSGWHLREERREGFRIHCYRPRIEGLFARIERWTRLEDGDTHWRVTSKDNVLTVYGGTPAARIFDPEQPSHVFKWLVSSSHDPAGNAIVYNYVAEDLRGVDRAAPSEQRRGRIANCYIKRILYGNRSPVRYGDPSHAATDWMFEVVFDYGDEAHDAFHYADETFVRFDGNASDWSARCDPFSTWRSGFEIRTHRLCRRALTVHHFPEELGRPRTFVRSTDFDYDAKPIGSLLTDVVQCGYRWMPQHDAYLKKILPPLALGYAPSPLENPAPRSLEWRDADAENLPEGIEGDRYRWVDLDGEGIAGVLATYGEGWYFKRNLGKGRFGAAKLIAHRPATARLGNAAQLLADVGGEGQLDLVDLNSNAAGFYERTRDPSAPGGLEAGWGRFRPFHDFPITSWADPNLRFVDLTGDGIADILITEEVALRWHPSLGARGFGSGLRVSVPIDENDGPRVVFSDPTQSIYLADMSGDGLTDIVRIRNGEVSYWPNRGYGRFGARILMGGSPWFDTPDSFDFRRIRLADTDGSGTTDILYLGGDAVQVYLNESGNSLSSPRMLHGLPDAADESVSVVDFLGRGTACLVWSSSQLAHAQRPLRYVDLMQGRKPHLLTSVRNNLGAETRIQYASSTEFYLADRAAGHPWLTPLPFPVHVVCRVETFDAVGRHRLVSNISYHHGYYDVVEREFRGFGRVDQRDTEIFADAGEPTSPLASNEAAAWRLPPVLTRTWYHTGVFYNSKCISRHLAQEYYHAPGESIATGLDDTVLPPDLTAEEAREACRSLKGTRLRQEIFALDGSRNASIPYSISEGNATVRLLQRRGKNLHCVFFAHPREALSLNLERKLYKTESGPRTDPRISHSVTLEVDVFGNPLLSASIAYGRRHADRSVLLSDADRANQAMSRMTVTENRYTTPVDRPDAYRTPLLAERRLYELVGVGVQHPRADPGAEGLLKFGEIARLIAVAGDGYHELPFEDFAAKEEGPGAGPFRRLIDVTRTRYRSDDLRHLLPLGELQALGLPGESYSLVLTPELIAQVYGDKLTEPWPLLHQECGFVDCDGDGRAWMPTGRIFYSENSQDDAAAELAEARRHFFLPRRFRDAFGSQSHVAYDPHDLVPVVTRDAVGNVTRARIDYRVMQAERITDPNGNRSDAAFNALGRVVGTALMGKQTESSGDSLEGFVADLPERVILAHLRDPLHDPWTILGNATSRLLYDPFAFDRTREEPHPRPAVTCSLARETHVSHLSGGTRTKVQQAFCYSDGFGREIQHKLRAESGPVPGHEDPIDPRWVGSGWTIFNNKGQPVRQYEPFFSSTPQFEFAAIVGVSTTLVYDPVGRVVATLNPDHTFQKTRFDPWRQEIWDTNDTVLLDAGQDPDIGPVIGSIPTEDYLPSWYQQRVSGALGKAEAEAANKAAVHRATPGVAFVDPLGRLFNSLAHNRVVRDGAPVDEFFATRSVIDIQGNERAVIDPLGRVVATYDVDFAGRRIHQHGADAGERWMLNDINGKPVLGFDCRHHRLHYHYDRLRRPTALLVRTGEGPERVAERTEYGEEQPEAQLHNLRGRLHRGYDGAGIATAASYDFKGNLLQTTRRMRVEYREPVDWAQGPSLETEVFSSETHYDALNRPVMLTAPDRSVLRPTYNEANLLEQLEVSLTGPDHFRPYVTQIEYNAKGQRVSIVHGNGARTVSSYDPLTFRLRHVRTHRHRDNTPLQDLSYVYDPVGNVTSIADDAQQTVYFKNQVVRANGDYEYDALYRLISASGREHVGHSNGVATSYNDAGRVHLPMPGDGHAMRRYREQYRYDPVGNILELLHTAPEAGSWRRQYHYGDIEANNRLALTRVGHDTYHYAYDAHGNMTRMQHLPVMRWDFKDQLAAAQTQVVKNGGEAPTTYYVYDSGGQRARKVVDDALGRRRCDRIYLAGFEVYREYEGESATLERTTLHVMDDKRRVALVETQGDVRTIRFQYDNHLGSSCLELDESAAFITYEEYYPYGSTSYQAGRSRTEVSLKRYRFTGKERDDGTGFSYHGARYYAPWLGRWVSCDPVGLADGINVYRYAAASPLRLVDPSGTKGSEPHPEDTDTHQFWPKEDKGGVVDDSSGKKSPGGPKPGFATSAWNWIEGAASAVWSWIKGAASAVGHAVKQAVSSAWEWAKQAAASAWNWAKQAASSAWNWTKQAASAAWSWTKQAAASAWNWTKHAAATAWAATKSAISTAWQWTRGAAAAAATWLKNKASAVWNSTIFRIIGHLTWGSLGTAVGALVTAVNLTIGNVVTAIHNAFSDDAHDWDYASISIGGPKDSNRIIGNYGGLFNLAQLGDAVTIGPFVYFEGSGADARAGGNKDTRDYYANETPSAIYQSQQGLLTSDHEEGHTDQNLLYGPLNLIFGVVFSLVPNALGKPQSSWWFWYDRQANKWSGSNNPFNPNTHVHP